MNTSIVLKSLLGVAAMTLPLVASAGSTYSTAATGPLSATASVDFQINIPKTLYLRVGTGSAYAATTPVLAADATINLVTFSPALGSVGNSTAVAGVGGDIGAGVVTAAIVSNGGGTVTYGATTASTGLTDGNGNYIAFSQITTAAAANTGGSYTTLAAPVLANGASANILLTPAAGKTTLADAKWTYSYANSVSPPAGTYGGAGTATAGLNGGRVTYTASML